MQVRYVNHLGATVYLDGDKTSYTTQGKVFEWEYTRQSFGSHTSDLYRESREFKLSGTVAARSKMEAAEKLDNIVNVMIVDTNTLDTGKLYVGDWYMPVYLVGKSGSRSVSKKQFKFELKFVSDDPVWVREKRQVFTSNVENESGLDYSHDYPHDYTRPRGVETLHNSSPVPCFSRISIPGPCNSGWQIKAGGNIYKCNLAINDGATLVIDSKAESITLVDRLGNRTNAYASRAGVFKEGSGSYIFEKVPAGNSNITWSGCTGFEFVVYEQRDEFLWADDAQ